MSTTTSKAKEPAVAALEAADAAASSPRSIAELEAEFEKTKPASTSPAKPPLSGWPEVEPPNYPPTPTLEPENPHAHVVETPLAESPQPAPQPVVASPPPALPVHASPVAEASVAVIQPRILNPQGGNTELIAQTAPQ